MAYHTTLYLFLFLPSAIITYQLMPVKYRWYVLLLLSYYFYYCISGALIIYIMATTITTYLSGILIEKKKGFLIFCILLLMENLAYMKYYNFFAANGNRIISFITSEQPFTLKAMILPIGISFYTLSAAGYLIDIYYKKNTGRKKYREAGFVSFFFSDYYGRTNLPLWGAGKGAVCRTQHYHGEAGNWGSENLLGTFQEDAGGRPAGCPGENRI